MFWEADGAAGGDDGMEGREEVRWKKSVTFRLGRVDWVFAVLLIAMERDGRRDSRLLWRSSHIGDNAL